MLDNITAAKNAMKMLADGRMIRGAFHRVVDGRKMACLYASAIPGAASVENCPASGMPQWVADLTPWIDDAGTPCTCGKSEDSIEARTATCVWHRNMHRYIVAMAQWHVLTDADWSNISRQFRAECCRSALASAATVVPAGAPYCPAVVAAVTAIRNCLLSGSEPTDQMWDAAARAKAAAARAAAADQAAIAAWWEAAEAATAAAEAAAAEAAAIAEAWREAAEAADAAAAEAEAAADQAAIAAWWEAAEAATAEAAAAAIAAAREAAAAIAAARDAAAAEAEAAEAADSLINHFLVLLEVAIAEKSGCAKNAPKGGQNG
jgi:hypothetical protein